MDNPAMTGMIWHLAVYPALLAAVFCGTMWTLTLVFLRRPRVWLLAAVSAAAALVALRAGRPVMGGAIHYTRVEGTTGDGREIYACPDCPWRAAVTWPPPVIEFDMITEGAEGVQHSATRSVIPGVPAEVMLPAEMRPVPPAHDVAWLADHGITLRPMEGGEGALPGQNRTSFT
jgi:hypothetical protein